MCRPYGFHFPSNAITPRFIRSFHDQNSMRRRDSLRLQGFDYSQEGYYFITICVNRGLFIFGKVRKGEMIMNQFGQVAKEQWEDMEKKYSFLELEEMIVMPDHLHLLLGIFHPRSLKRSLEPKKDQRKNLSTLISEFKAGVSKQIREMGYGAFQWQRSYYDRVVRNDKEFWAIKRYIKENPARWVCP